MKKMCPIQLFILILATSLFADITSVLWIQNTTYPGWNSCDIYNTTFSGYSAIREETEALGFVHTQVDQSEILSPGLLLNYDILVLGPLLDESFTSAESAAVAEFVAKKRGVLALTSGATSTLVTNRLITQFGLTYVSPTYEPGRCTDITSHALTTGVDSVYGEGALQINCSEIATSLIRDSFGRTALGIYELDDCKVAAFFDEQFMWNGPTSGIYTDITEADNGQLAINLFLWLAGRISSEIDETIHQTHAQRLPCEMKMRISPNPFNSAIEINFELVGDCNCKHNLVTLTKIDIFDINGRYIYSTSHPGISGKASWIPDNEIPSGTYFIRVSSGFANTTQKISYLK
jgi:hypothetical protein